MAEDLIAAGDAVVVNGLTFPAQNYKLVVGSYGWWRLVNRSSRAALLLIDQGFSSPEIAPLMRNVFNHAYALNWLVDNGEAAVDAVISAGAAAHEKLLKKLKDTGWAIAAEYDQALAQQAPEPARTPAEQALHEKLLHELGNVHDMLDRYGSAELYPVYSHLSSLSHTSTPRPAAADSRCMYTMFKSTSRSTGPAMGCCTTPGRKIMTTSCSSTTPHPQ
ncbi:hypothetical protein O1M63_26190 [Streptomyces mirabilis]|nr:hypothetical protein [Streptomyces mirabilis]